MSLTLMSFSGCEPEPLTPTDVIPSEKEIITLVELDGDWNIVSYKLSETDHNTFTTCEDIENNPATHYENYGLLLLNFKFNSENMGCEILDKCYAQQFNDFGMFKLENNIITISEISSFIFKVKSYNKTNKRLILELELENIGNLTAPIGGIYEIQKQ